MSWMGVGVVGGGLLGAYQGQQGAKAQAKANQANLLQQAALTEFSPWTKVTPQAANIQAVNPTAGLTGALEGGLGGLMQAQKIKDANALADKRKLAEEQAKALQDGF